MDEKIIKIACNNKFLDKHPEIAKDVVSAIMQHPEGKIMQGLLTQGDIINDDDELQKPEKGTVILGFDKVNVRRLYNVNSDYGKILYDCQIPDNNPVSQYVYNDENHRVVIPYQNLSQSVETVTEHVNIIKEAVCRVCQDMELQVGIPNIICNYDQERNCILQIANHYVKNFEENKELVNLVIQDLQKHNSPVIISVSITSGFDKFRHNGLFQKYPLLDTNNQQVYGALQSLVQTNQDKIHVNINIHIDGDVIVNNINGNHNIIQQKVVSETIKYKINTVEGFVEYLKNTPPDWVKDLTHITGTELCARYNEFAKTKLTPQTFGKILNKRYSGLRDHKKINLIRLLKRPK